MFVVHRKPSKTNMEFRHFYDPGKEDNAQLAFVNIVAENKFNFTKRQIKDDEVARILYATLGRPSMRDFKWIIRSHQIKKKSCDLPRRQSRHLHLGEEHSYWRFLRARLREPSMCLSLGTT